MTKTMWTSVPAGVLGQGAADVRPYPGVVVCPTPPAFQGTGLRAVGARFRARTDAVAVLTRTHAPATSQSIAQNFIQNDGTTLGIHTPGRPQS